MSTGGEIHAGSVVADLEVRVGKAESQLQMAQREFDKLAQAAQLLQLKLDAGAITSDRYAQEISRIGPQMQRWSGVIDGLKTNLASLSQAQQASATATVQVTSSMSGVEKTTEQARSKVAGFGQSMMQAGRSVQDFQAAGLRGILNNIEGLTMSMGGTAGLAGVLTMAAVAFEVFKPAIMGFVDSLGLGEEGAKGVADQIVDLKDRIKELTEKPNKISIDYHNLEDAQRQVERLQAGLKTFESLRTGPTQEQQAAGRFMHEAITEHAGGTPDQSGAENLAAAIRDIAKRDPDRAAALGLMPLDTRGDKLPALEKRKVDLEEQIRLPMPPAMAAERARRLAETKQEIETLRGLGAADAKTRSMATVGRAAEGDQKVRAGLEQAMKEFGDVFELRGIGKGFQTSLEAARPENQGLEDYIKADQAESKERLKRRKAAEKQAEEDQARETKEQDAENLRQFKANTASRQRRVKEVAGEFLSPTGGKITDTGRAALEGKLSVQDIEKHLLAMGADPEKAGRAAEDVGKQVEKNAGKLIGKRAAEERISPEEARKAILADDDERRRQGEKQRADRLQKQAEEKLPGLDALTRREIGLRINAGQTEESATAGATRAIEAALVKAGMKPGDAKAAATEEVGDTAHKMSAAMAEHAMKGDQEQRRNSEIVRAEDLQGKIQASIGAADPQLQQMKEIAKILGLQYRAMEEQAKRPQVAVLGR
jgi:hypothetical protein